MVCSEVSTVPLFSSKESAQQWRVCVFEVLTVLYSPNNRSTMGVFWSFYCPIFLRITQQWRSILKFPPPRSSILPKNRLLNHGVCIFWSLYCPFLPHCSTMACVLLVSIVPILPITLNNGLCVFFEVPVLILRQTAQLWCVYFKASRSSIFLRIAQQWYCVFLKFLPSSVLWHAHGMYFLEFLPCPLAS
jgi:hypothetical protein